MFEQLIRSPQEGGYAFLLSDFTIGGPIVDSSPNEIPLIVSGVTVVESSFGPAIKFDGSVNNYIELISPKLNFKNFELEFHLCDMVYITERYEMSLLDCRPTQDNGPYGTYSLTTNRFQMHYYNMTRLNQPLSFTGLSIVKVSVTDGHVKIILNGTMHELYLEGITFYNQQPRLGLSAFSASGVPSFRGSLLRFSIRELP